MHQPRPTTPSSAISHIHFSSPTPHHTRIASPLDQPHVYHHKPMYLLWVKTRHRILHSSNQTLLYTAVFRHRLCQSSRNYATMHQRSTCTFTRARLMHTIRRSTLKHVCPLLSHYAYSAYHPATYGKCPGLICPFDTGTNSHAPTCLLKPIPNADFRNQ